MEQQRGLERSSFHLQKGDAGRLGAPDALLQSDTQPEGL